MKYMNRPKSAAVKDIDIVVANILGTEISILAHCDIDPPLIHLRIVVLFNIVIEYLIDFALESQCFFSFYWCLLSV